MISSGSLQVTHSQAALGPQHNPVRSTFWLNDSPRRPLPLLFALNDELAAQDHRDREPIRFGPLRRHMEAISLPRKGREALGVPEHDRNWNTIDKW